MVTFYSAAQISMQRKHGGEKVANALYQHRVHKKLLDYEIQFIGSVGFFIIASSGESGIDCSIKCGDPGFVKVSAEGEIIWPDYDGNLMFRTLGNISENSEVALLFCNFKEPSKIASQDQIAKLRVNGRARIEYEFCKSEYLGAKALVIVQPENIIPNCPRYLPDLELASNSKYNPKFDGQILEPEWKSREYIRDILPK